MDNMPQPILELRNIRKEFPGGVVANDGISLSVSEGEVHGLLGENGAGKTTLMNILFGLYNADEGEIFFNGDLVQIDEPGDAIDVGIGMVHQHFKLIPRLSVVENVALSKNEPEFGGLLGELVPPSAMNNRVLRRLLSPFAIDLSATREHLASLMDEYNMDIDPDTRVWELDVGQQQRVEILKALYRDVDLLVLDEPSAVLSETEAERLFETVAHLRDEGVSVILITHKLEEIKGNTDRVTVLRDGRVIDTVDTAGVTKAELAEMMVGREVLFEIEKPSLEPGTALLSGTDLRADNDRGLTALDGVDIEIGDSEIVGIAGVSGNGQMELAECLAGVRDLTGGSIRMGGTDLTGRPTRKFVNSGISYIPADRFKYGSVPSMSVMHNLIMKERDQFVDGRFIDYGAATEYAERLIEAFDIKVPNPDVPAEKLSGGNLQKVILARELSRDPAVIIANQPTRGLDVGAIEFVRETLISQRESGTGILFISEDLEEVLAMADRVLVMYDGQVIHETTDDRVDREAIGRMMTEGRGDVRSSVTDESAPSGAAVGGDA